MPRRNSAKKNDLKPHLKKTWCIGEFDSRFVARMEQILHLYALPYDARYPVVCFDERPCFLIGEAVAPLNPSPGQIAREHYAYTTPTLRLHYAYTTPTLKKVRAVYWVLSNRSPGHDWPKFTSNAPSESTRCSCKLSQALSLKYPDAVKIRIVQDNLNTHDYSSFYETFTPEEAFALTQRFEFFFTPKCASWLNMIEIEFSALARECLHRRIPTQEQLEREVLTLVHEREAKGIKINWQFSIEKARIKLKSRYEGIRECKTT